MEYFRYLLHLVTTKGSRNRNVSELPGQPRIRYTAEERWVYSTLPFTIATSYVGRRSDGRVVTGRVNEGFDPSINGDSNV